MSMVRVHKPQARRRPHPQKPRTPHTFQVHKKYWFWTVKFDASSSIVVFIVISVIYMFVCCCCFFKDILSIAISTDPSMISNANKIFIGRIMLATHVWLAIHNSNDSVHTIRSHRMLRMSNDFYIYVLVSTTIHFRHFPNKSSLSYLYQRPLIELVLTTSSSSFAFVFAFKRSNSL